MSIVLRIMVLIVEGRIARRPVHHAGRLSVHHVAHRRIRTVCPAWSCGQWWKHYTLLRLDLCSVIGRRVLDKLADPFQSSRGTRELDDHSILSPLVAKRQDERDREEHASRGTASCVTRFAKVTITTLITPCVCIYIVNSDFFSFKFANSCFASHCVKETQISFFQTNSLRDRDKIGRAHV